MKTIDEKFDNEFCDVFDVAIVVNILLPKDEPQRLYFHNLDMWYDYLSILAGSVDMKEVQAAL